MLVLVSCCAFVSCKKSEATEPAGGDPTGTWVGDFGPAFYDRNTISVELHWDGKELTGNIRPGVQGGRMYRDFKAFPIENALFDPSTGAVKFEATYSPRGRRYIIAGKVTKNTFSGTWNRPEENKDGDFKLTRKAKS
jgi:hypothetical protein